MKKALRHKKTKEFIHIEELDDVLHTFTSEHPNLLADTATIEGLKDYYEGKSGWTYIGWDDFELVEFELVEVDTIGADIRNKLTPPKNLVALLEVFFADSVAYASKGRAELVELIKKEMENTKKSVDYIAKLL